MGRAVRCPAQYRAERAALPNTVPRPRTRRRQFILPPPARQRATRRPQFPYSGAPATHPYHPWRLTKHAAGGTTPPHWEAHFTAPGPTGETSTVPCRGGRGDLATMPPTPDVLFGGGRGPRAGATCLAGGRPLPTCNYGLPGVFLADSVFATLGLASRPQCGAEKQRGVGGNRVGWNHTGGELPLEARPGGRRAPCGGRRHGRSAERRRRRYRIPPPFGWHLPSVACAAVPPAGGPHASRLRTRPSRATIAPTGGREDSPPLLPLAAVATAGIMRTARRWLPPRPQRFSTNWTKSVWTSGHDNDQSSKK